MHDCLLDIVRDREQAKPVCHQLAAIVGVALHDCVLVLDHFADRSDCIISSVVIHLQLLLLALNLRSHGEVDACL